MDITVITPFYKGNAYMQGLFSCISRCAQKTPQLQIELLLVNDSPDCAIEYDPQWVCGFSLQICSNPQNAGIHRSRVNGLNAAKGEFIQFLDQDDLLEEDTFATQYPLMQNADVAVANGFDQNPHCRGPIYKSLRHQQQAIHDRFYYTVGNQIISPGQCLIRKSAIPQPWYDTCVHRNGSDDLLLWLMMFRENARFVLNPRQLYTHVETGHNVSADIEKMYLSSQEVLTLLKSTGSITSEQEKQFLRSRAMGRRYAGKGKCQKVFAMLCYPDVAWERLTLHRYQKTRS